MSEKNLKLPSELLEPFILVHSLSNISFFLKIKPYLDTNSQNGKMFFNDEKLQILFNIICKWYDKKFKFPTRVEFKILLDRLYGAKGKMQDAEMLLLLNAGVDKIYTESPEDVDLDYIEDETKKFIQENRVYEAMMLSQIDVEKGNYGVIADRMHDAISVNFDKDLGVSVRDIDDGLELLNELNSENTISTGIPPIDVSLDGGWRDQEYYVFSAPPGIGKCLHYDVFIDVAWEWTKEQIRVGDLFKLLNMNKQGTYEAPKHLKILTSVGYKKVKALLHTQLNKEWFIKTKAGRYGTFADDHKLEVRKSDIYDVGSYWELIKNIKVGDQVNTEEGWETVLECYYNGKESHMFDLEVEDIKSFYANGFNSHNTALLGQFAVNAFLQGKNVLVYTFETSKKRLLSRYYTNLLDLTKKEIVFNQDETKTKMSDVLSMTQGDIIIKEYPANVTSSNDLMGHINDLMLYKNWKPDIIIADYILIMSANDKSTSSENSYKYYKTVSEENRNLAKMLNVPFITAAQINRSGMDEKGGTKALMTSKDVSESRGIIDTCDFFATINQTAKDRDKNEVMIYVDKSRNGVKGDKIKLSIDYDHMRFTEL